MLDENQKYILDQRTDFEGPCLEKYYWTDKSQTESICEVWIPVKRKA